MKVLTIDIGGTFVKYGLFEDNTLSCVDKFPYKRINDLATDIFAHVKETIDLNSFDLIGVCSPGYVDENGVMRFAGNLYLKNYDVKSKLEKLFNKKVTVINDANAAVIAEAKLGAATGIKNVLLLTLGTGVGGGVIMNGNLLLGNHNAGAEIGHVTLSVDGRKCTCGNKGCIEAYCSVTALVNFAKEKGLDVNYGIDVSNLAKNGNEEAIESLNEWKYYLKEAITSLINMFRPEIVLLAGGGSNEESLYDYLNDEVNLARFGGENSPEVRISKAKFENEAGLLGAAIYASKENK